MTGASSLSRIPSADRERGGAGLVWCVLAVLERLRMAGRDRRERRPGAQLRGSR